MARAVGRADPRLRLTGTDLTTAISNGRRPHHLAEFARTGLIEFPDIFTHQRDSLAARAGGRNVVVTAGTGSGKTEWFLLPLLDAPSRVKCMDRHVADRPKAWNRANEFVPQRLQETGRTRRCCAVLYPMNALVEDQLGRLRRASIPLRAWLDENRRGPSVLLRPVHGQNTGARGPAKQAEAKSSPRAGERTTEALRARADDPDEALFPPEPRRCGDAKPLGHAAATPGRPDHELLDAQHHAAATAGVRDDSSRPDGGWKRAASKVFHVIVDELHMYRGTSGTEVAYLIRNLLHRLGLHPDSDQVRFLATSASLGTGEEAKAFLSGVLRGRP